MKLFLLDATKYVAPQKGRKRESSHNGKIIFSDDSIGKLFLLFDIKTINTSIFTFSATNDCSCSAVVVADAVSGCLMTEKSQV